jgi:hypothetical protein
VGVTVAEDRPAATLVVKSLILFGTETLLELLIHYNGSHGQTFRA